MTSAAYRLQRRSHDVEPNYTDGVASFDRRFRHAIHHAGLFALRDRHAALFLDGSQAFGSIVSHPRHQYSNGTRTELFGHAPQENIYAGTVTIHSGFVAEHSDVAEGKPFHFHVPASRADQHSSGHQEISRLRFFHAQWTNFIQSPRKHVGESIRHVLHHGDRSRKVARQL
jgi:hypothetical protein